jgi:hypothetical protein
MIEDGLLQFTGTAGTAGSTDAPTTGTQTSTNILDMANTRDMGIGDDPALEILVRVLTAFASGTSLQVNLQGAPDSSGSPGTWTTYVAGPVVAEAQLVVGAGLLETTIPRTAPGVANPRFYRLQYVTVGTHTAGAIHGAVVLDRQDNVYYPPGIVIAN